MSTNDDLAGPVPLNENQELIGESEGAEMAASTELEQPAPEERSVIHRDSAQTVSAEQVEIHQGGAQTVKAQQVEIRQGGAQYVEADKVSMEQSGALCMRAEQATITASTVGILASERVSLEESSSAGMILAKRVDCPRVTTSVLLAGEVYGNVETVVDTRGALLLGLGLGAGLGLLLSLVSLISDRE
jgi:hypothetical protein